MTNDMEILKAIEEGLPIHPRPFREIAQKLGASEQFMIDSIDKMLEKGLLRRFGAILSHRHAGFRINAMVVWDIPDADSNRVAEAFSSLSSVSHCYIRPRIAGKWKYNLFTMAHFTSEEEMGAFLNKGTEITDEASFKVLRTLREFKKTGVRL